MQETSVKQSVGPLVAIKRFLELDSKRGPISVQELNTFRAGCTQDELREFATHSAEAIGCQLNA